MIDFIKGLGHFLVFGVSEQYFARLPGFGGEQAMQLLHIFVCLSVSVSVSVRVRVSVCLSVCGDYLALIT